MAVAQMTDNGLIDTASQQREAAPPQTAVCRSPSRPRLQRMRQLLWIGRKLGKLGSGLPFPKFLPCLCKMGDLTLIRSYVRVV